MAVLSLFLYPVLLLFAFRPVFTFFTNFQSVETAFTHELSEEQSTYTFLFKDDKFIQEIKTSDHAKYLFQYLVTPSQTISGSPSIAREFKVSPDDQLYLILYYAAWCPHCHRFSHIWRSLANTFRCTKGIRFFAFECSINTKDRIGEKNVSPMDFCFSSNMTGYPTVFAYLPKRLDANQAFSNTSIRQSEGSNSSEFSIANVTASDFSHRLQDRKKDAEAVELTFNVTGKDGMSNTEVLLKTKVEKRGSFAELRDWITWHTPIREVKKCFFASDSVSLKVSESSAELSTDKVRWPPHLFNSCPDVRLHDAINGLLYLLRNWVAADLSSGGLAGKKKEDLLGLISTLGTLLPGRNIQLSLQTFHDALQSRSSMTAAKYQALVDRLDLGGLKALPIGTNPILLQDSQLTSSIWLLFHVETLAYYAQAHGEETKSLLNSKQSCANSFNSETKMNHRHQFTNELRSAHPVTAWTIASTIRSTVENFFGCEECRDHFIKFFDSGVMDLHAWLKPDGTYRFEQPLLVQSGTCDGQFQYLNDSAEGLMLWFWRFHNGVTFRTAVERLADSIVTLQEESGYNEFEWKKYKQMPGYAGQDVRFPPRQFCSACRCDASSSPSSNSRAFLSPKHDKLTPDAFNVSQLIVETAVRLERVNRGVDSEDAYSREQLTPLDEKTWDRIEDFNVQKVKEFLIGYLWRQEWSDSSVDLIWEEGSKVFTLVP